MMLDEMNLHALVEAPRGDDAGASEQARPAIPQHPAHNGLQVPTTIWRAMFACYGLFFGGLLYATGRDGEALFMIAISVGYAILYFGLSGVLIGLDGHRFSPENARPAARLETWTGPMSHGAVVGQILAVPLCLALFGIAIALIRAWVG